MTPTPREKYQAELAAHVLLYVQRIADDPATLRAIGVTQALALSLRDLSLRDLLRIGHHTRHIVIASLRIDHECLQALLDAAIAHTALAPCQGWHPASEPHTALVEHLLLMVVRTLDEGHARSIGLTESEIIGLWSLTPAQLRWIAGSRAHFVNVRIDPDRLRALIEQIERGHEEELLQMALLRSRAPSALMHELYGWRNADFAARRRMLSLNWTGRAPAFRSDEQAWEAEQLWLELEQQPDSPPLAQRYLQIANQLDVGIDTLWQMVSRLSQDRQPLRKRPRLTSITPVTSNAGS